MPFIDRLCRWLCVAKAGKGQRGAWQSGPLNSNNKNLLKLIINAGIVFMQTRAVRVVNFE